MARTLESVGGLGVARAAGGSRPGEHATAGRPSTEALDLGACSNLYGDSMAVSCSCGCGAIAVVTRAARPCSCGCSCCGPGLTPAEEVAELLSLRTAVQHRLDEIHGAGDETRPTGLALPRRMVAPAETAVAHSEIDAWAEATVGGTGASAAARIARARRAVAAIRGAGVSAVVDAVAAGSVVKGTAVAGASADVAVFVRPQAAPADAGDVPAWLAGALSAAGVDAALGGDGRIRTGRAHEGVVLLPVVVAGADRRFGRLVLPGGEAETDVGAQLEFHRALARAHGPGYARLVRIVKWWAALAADRDPEFALESVVIEPLCAVAVRRGADVADIPDALTGVFAYVVETRLTEPISAVPALVDPPSPPVLAPDPGNPANNLAAGMTGGNASAVVAAAADALDAIGQAHFAPRRSGAVPFWQFVLGSSFPAPD